MIPRGRPSSDGWACCGKPRLAGRSRCWLEETGIGFWKEDFAAATLGIDAVGTGLTLRESRDFLGWRGALLEFARLFLRPIWLASGALGIGTLAEFLGEAPSWDPISTS